MGIELEEVSIPSDVGLEDVDVTVPDGNEVCVNACRLNDCTAVVLVRLSCCGGIAVGVIGLSTTSMEF